MDPHPSQFHFLGRLGMCLEPCAVEDPEFMGVAEHEKPGESVFEDVYSSMSSNMASGNPATQLVSWDHPSKQMWDFPTSHVLLPSRVSCRMVGDPTRSYFKAMVKV